MAERQKPTVDQVIAEADSARQQLASLERVLQEEIDEIDFRAFREGRALVPTEVERRRELRATQSEVREDFTVLAFVTAERLGETAEVDRLLRQMQLVNAGLEDDLARLRQVERYADVTAKVTDLLARTTAQLAEFAGKTFV